MILGTTVASTAPIGASRAQAATSDRIAYVTNIGDDTVTPIDIATNTAEHPTHLAAPEGAASIAITPNGASAYVTNPDEGTVSSIELATTAQLDFGIGGAVGVAIAPDGSTVYVTSAGGGTVTPINVATNTVGTPIPVGSNAEGIAITPNGATAYVANGGPGGTLGGDNTVTPIDTATHTVGNPIPVGAFPLAIAITPNGATAYVTNYMSSSVTPINIATNAAGTPIPVGILPGAIGITPSGSTAYVTSNSGNTVTPINIASNTAGSPITVGLQPDGVAITPDGATAYVADGGSDTVTPINIATNTAGSPITVGPGPNGVAITPDQAPVSSLSVAPAGAGQPTSFDASASTVAYGSISAYVWDFGDGSSATTSVPTTTHTYATPGPYTASVTETDSAGTSTAQIFTGQTMSRNGGPSAVASKNFTVVPPSCAGRLKAHVLTATYQAGTFTGLFCINAKGIGTYTQGAVSGSGSVKVVQGTTVIGASGINLALLGATNGTRSGFVEFAPAPIKLGTFTLS